MKGVMVKSLFFSMLKYIELMCQVEDQVDVPKRQKDM